MASDVLPMMSWSACPLGRREVARSDLAAYFTLSLDDLRWLRSHRGAVERVGLAVQMGALRFLGFVPAESRRCTPRGRPVRRQTIGAARLVSPATPGMSTGGPGAGTSPRWWNTPAGGPVAGASGRRSETGWSPGRWSTTHPRCCSPRPSTSCAPSRSYGPAWTG